MGRLPDILAKKPYIPEHDLAGIIVDANGTNLREGDLVYGWNPVCESSACAMLSIFDCL